MKNLILISILLIPIISFSQLNTSAAIGYDTHGRPMAQWGFGIEAGQFNVSGQIRPSLTRSVFAHNYLGASIGFNIFNPGTAYLKALSIIPSVGYFYDLKSQDKTNLNKYYWSAGIKTIKMLKEEAGLFIETIYINHSVQASFGMHLIFTKN